MSKHPQYLSSSLFPHGKWHLTLGIHGAVDVKPDKLPNVKAHVYLRDEGLTETLKKGIDYFHEAMDKQDECIGWTWHGSSDCLRYGLLHGMRFYEGKERQYIDYLIMDVLQVMDRAMMKHVLMCQQTRKT